MQILCFLLFLFKGSSKCGFFPPCCPVQVLSCALCLHHVFLSEQIKMMMMMMMILVLPNTCKVSILCNQIHVYSLIWNIHSRDDCWKHQQVCNILQNVVRPIQCFHSPGWRFTRSRSIILCNIIGHRQLQFIWQKIGHVVYYVNKHNARATVVALTYRELRSLLTSSRS